jgi:RES domain-containing protein
LILYRISNHPDLTGLGGELADGRWHTREKGRRIVYTSDHPALCILEVLVHVDHVDDMPDHYQLLRMDVPDQHIADVGRLPKDWTTNLSFTRAEGNRWLTSGISGGLLVPSALAPFSRNCLLNPKVPAIAAIKPEVVGRFPFDQRLLGRYSSRTQRHA